MPGIKLLKQVWISHASLMFEFPNIFTLPFCISPTTWFGIVKCPGREMSGDILQPPQGTWWAGSLASCSPPLVNSYTHVPARCRVGHRLLPWTENISETYFCKIIARKIYRLTWSSYNNCPPISLFHKCVILACELSPLTFPSVSILLLFLVALWWM